MDTDLNSMVRRNFSWLWQKYPQSRPVEIVRPCCFLYFPQEPKRLLSLKKEKKKQCIYIFFIFKYGGRILYEEDFSTFFLLRNQRLIKKLTNHIACYHHYHLTWYERLLLCSLVPRLFIRIRINSTSLKTIFPRFPNTF